MFCHTQPQMGLRPSSILNAPRNTTEYFNTKKPLKKMQRTDEQTQTHTALTTATGPRKALQLKSYDIKHKYKN